MSINPTKAIALKTFLLMLSAITASVAQSATPLTEFPPRTEPCEYRADGLERLEAAGYDKDNTNNRIQVSWMLRPQEGQTDCDYRAGFENSCALSTFLVRVRSGCFLGFCRTAQVIYQYEGGVKPSDLCEVD